VNYSAIRSDSREKLKGNWGTGALIVFLYAIISTAVEGIGVTFGGLWGIIGTIVFIVMYGPLQYGISNVFLKINRREKADVGDLFSGFSDNMAQKVSAGLSVYVYTFLWALLFVIPGIIASYSYALTYYILKDNPNINPNEAIARSKNIMKGHKMELFLLDLSFIGWIILGVLSCGIGLFWVVPYMQTARAKFYEDLVGPSVTVLSPEGQKESSEETVIKNESETTPFEYSSDANEVYTLICETCGATESHTEKSTNCPYCGGKMKVK